MSSSSPVLRFPALLLASLLASAACEGTGPIVQETDVPPDIATLQDEIIALQVGGEEGRTYRELISVEPLRKKVEGLEEVLLLEYSADSLTRVAYEWEGEAVAAELRGGRTYLLTAVPVGRLLASYRLVCYFDRSRTEISMIDPSITDRLCPVILCPAEPFRADMIAERIPELAGGERWFDFGAGEYSGWGQGSLCDRCTGIFDAGPRIPTCEIWKPPASGCANTIFHADFEADALGSPPATSPAGAPPGDAFSYVPPDNIPVIESLPLVSRAALIERGSTTPTVFSAIPDAGPHTTGTYEISYKAYSAVGGPNTPAITVSVRSPTGDVAFRLIMNDGSYSLVTGAGARTLSQTYAVSSPDEISATIDLDSGTVSIEINGTSVAAGEAFADSGFAELGELRIEHVAAILEAFPAELVIDDIHMCKT